MKPTIYPRPRRKHILLTLLLLLPLLCETTPTTRSPSSDHRRHKKGFLLRSDGPGHLLFSAGEVRRDHCRTIPFNQTVSGGPGCRPKTVRNHLCYGQCNSFFVPESTEGGKVAFMSCSYCKPHRLRWVTVGLRCKGHKGRVRKTVLKIESCRCVAAERDEVDRNLQYLMKGRH